ncbi:unnamed protein product [Pedinophyceae sp. YPF-701]|nr:unnamed protein product [Pedinophyceae sp. YPF-701]
MTSQQTRAPVRPKREPKPPGEIVRYTREFLLSLAETNVRAPTELEGSTLPLVLLTGEQRDRQRQHVRELAGEGADASTWGHSPASFAAAQNRTPATPGAGAGGTGNWAPQPGGTPRSAARGTDDASARIQKASDVGRTAWRPVAPAHGKEGAPSLERVGRQIRGILNKLAPEKFERLLGQMLEIVTTAEALRLTISLVFEKAVAEPTFCNLYAELCEALSRELPEFPPPEGESRPIKFVKVLLNTCHDEFEAARDAREKLRVAKPEDAAEAERHAKSRTMGTVRLIAHLHLREAGDSKVVPKWVMYDVIQDLLGSGKATPSEIAIEAVCELFSIAGKTLDAEAAPARKGKGDRNASRDMELDRQALEKSFGHLKKMSEDQKLASRLRFMIREVLDTRANNWVPRRETLQAKKLDEIHAEAAAAGITMTRPTPAAAPAPGAPILPGMSQGPPRPEEVALFPALRASDALHAQAARSTMNTHDGKASRLIGDIAIAEQVSPPQPSGNELTPEELENKTRGLIEEFVAVQDAKEAKLCLQEVNQPGWMPQLLQQCVYKTLDLLDAKSQGAVCRLIELAVTEKFLGKDDVVAGLESFFEMFEDLKMDYPKAPEQLGMVTATLMKCGVFPASAVAGGLSKVEDMFDRRDLAAAILKQAQDKMGAQALATSFREEGLSASAFLAADPERDGEHPDVADFLKEHGLTGVPV